MSPFVQHSVQMVRLTPQAPAFAPHNAWTLCPPNPHWPWGSVVAVRMGGSTQSPNIQEWEPGQPTVRYVRKLWTTVINALTTIRVGLVWIR